MAYINMFNNDQQQGHCTSIPRISFSSDFADAQQQGIKHENSYREPPVSSDFEFSLSNFGMIAADELIVKGKLLPLKELLADEEDDEYDHVFQRPPKSSGRWKEKLGLKRSQFVPKKADKGQELYKRYFKTY